MASDLCGRFYVPLAKIRIVYYFEEEKLHIMTTLSDRENARWHTSQEYFFSPVCTMVWRINKLEDVNDLPQMAHRNDVSGKCIFLWSLRYRSWAKPVI